MIGSLWSVHLITIMQAQGLSLAAAVALGTLIGPAQVGARLLEMMLGGRHHPVWTLLAATGLIAAAFAMLLAPLPAAAALLAYGAGFGIWSIARGTLPLAVFGPQDYAPTVGMIAAPALFGSALAPSIGAVLIERAGPEGTLTVLAVATLVPLVCAALILGLVTRRRT